MRNPHRDELYSLRWWELRALLHQSWLAARLSLWLFWLPVLLRVHSLPVLLEQLTPPGGQPRSSPLEVERTVRIVVRMCRLRLFRLPIFPRPCLRQSLALYHVLTWAGYPVEIHFGIRRQGTTLQGHSWVTMQGKPVAERGPTGVFQIIYSHPSDSSRSMPGKIRRLLDSQRSIY